MNPANKVQRRDLTETFKDFGDLFTELVSRYSGGERVLTPVEACFAYDDLRKLYKTKIFKEIAEIL